jgi:excisionase family DNA binding protein
MKSSQTPHAASSGKMLDVQAVANQLCCSPRHIYRLLDIGRMPVPVKLGALIRWPKQVIDDWVNQGCPSCDEGGAE